MRAWIIIVVGMLVLVGCRAEESEPGGTQPEADPAPATFTPTSGEATVDVTGDVEAILDLTLAQDVEQRAGSPPDVVGLSFVDADDNRLTITGPLREGENPTSETLTVDLSLPDGVFMSAEDQCVVTVHRQDRTAVEGKVGCADLFDGTRAVNITGSFSAAA